MRKSKPKVIPAFDRSKMTAIILYWEYRPPKGKSSILSRVWHLKEYYPVDLDGRALVPTSTDWYGRRQYDAWLHRYPKKNSAVDGVPVPGRAVTLWQSSTGVSLVGLNPPTSVPWLSDEFPYELVGMDNWAVILDRGYQLHLGTVEVATGLLFSP